MSGTLRSADAQEFSLADARRAISDLFRPRESIYWVDFVLTYALGIFCFQQVRGGSLFVPHQGFQGTVSQTLYFFASCLLFYRASMFIHEIVHQRPRGRLRVFAFVWNLLCGVPFLIPSFVYLPHIDHHRRQHFGTDRDGEYLPLGRAHHGQILFYLSWSLVIPLVAIVRFFVLTPLAWTVPGFRNWVHQRASSMVMDPSYIRPLPTAATRRIILIQELACFLWCLGIAVIPPVFLGRMPFPFLVHAYLMAVVIVTLNSVRTLGAHRWHNEGEPMTFVDQLLDSVNYPHQPWLSELWGPVGTRYHALHHLFPSLPYHALPAAHRRLMEALPANSPYRAVEEESLLAGLADLWRRTRPARQEKRAGDLYAGSELRDNSPSLPANIRPDSQ